MKGKFLTAIFIVMLSLAFVSAINTDYENPILSNESFLNVTWPLEDSLHVKLKVDFKIVASKKLAKIEYINYNDLKPKYRTICENCNSFGLDREKKLTMNEGLNNLTIRGIDSNYNYNAVNLAFRVDSVSPKTFKITPRTNAIVNGSKFSVTYTEMNLQNIILHYYNDGNMRSISQNCTQGKMQTCDFSPDLSEFDGKDVYFYFYYKDPIDGFKTGTSKIRVDMVPPVLSISNPVESRHYYRNVPITISSTKKAKIQYIDIFANQNHLVWKTLCTDCIIYNKTMNVRLSGTHQFFVRAVDSAGNSDEKNVTFIMD